MRARDADQPPDPEVENLQVTGESVQHGHADTDIIESEPEPNRVRLPRPPRATAVALVLALIIAGATAGYLVGSHGSHRTTTTPGAPPSSTTPAGTQPIAGTGNRCSAQLGDQLQLGIEIINRSTTTITLHQVQAVLPLHGLRPTSSTWGSCGQLSPPAGGHDYPLPAGATNWLTITFDVLVPCPGGLPVLFTFRYTQAGRPGTAGLPGFPDLGDVPYTTTKCPTSSS